MSADGIQILTEPGENFHRALALLDKEAFRIFFVADMTKAVPTTYIEDGPNS